MSHLGNDQAKERWYEEALDWWHKEATESGLMTNETMAEAYVQWKMDRDGHGDPELFMLHIGGFKIFEGKL